MSLLASRLRPLVQSSMSFSITRCLSRGPRRGSGDDVMKHLKKNELFKDVIPEFTPKVRVQALFASSGDEALLGNTIAPGDAKDKPQVEITPFANEDSLPSDLIGKEAFLVMTDPDAPKREKPEWSEFCHWIASIKLPTSKDGGEVVYKGSSFKELIEYMGPAPPEGTGKHRYLLLVLQGDATDVEGPAERKKWGNEDYRTGVAQWAKKYNLKPIGANFFFSEDKGDLKKDQ